MNHTREHQDTTRKLSGCLTMAARTFFFLQQMLTPFSPFPNSWHSRFSNIKKKRPHFASSSSLLTKKNAPSLQPFSLLKSPTLFSSFPWPFIAMIWSAWLLCMTDKARLATWVHKERTNPSWRGE